MCSPTAAVVGIGLVAAGIAQQRARADARGAARRAREAELAATEQERQRIETGVADVNTAFDDPNLERQIDTLARQRETGARSAAEEAFEQRAGQLDLRSANTGLAVDAGRTQRNRQRLLRQLAERRAGAAIDANAVRDRLRGQLDSARLNLIERIRGGAANPGAEAIAAQQAGILSEARAMVPYQTGANVVNQTAGVVQTDQRARAGGNAGIESLDWMNKQA